MIDFGVSDLLILQVDRLVFNSSTFQAEKINSRFIYKEKLNSLRNNCCSEEEYHLLSVIIHNGVANGGHYYF